MAYEDILKKYNSSPALNKGKANVFFTQALPKKEEPVKLTVRQVDELKDNPYKGFVEKYKTSKLQKSFDEGTKATTESIEKDLNPGIKRTILDTAKAVPRSFYDILTNPKASVPAIPAGFLDVGPQGVNLAHALGTSILGIVYGKDNAPSAFKLPKPGSTLMDYLEGKGVYDEKEAEIAGAVRTGAEWTAGYALGQNTVKVAGGGAVAQNILGDVIGGQATIEPDVSAKERVSQAAFDVIFGIAQMAGGRVFRKVVNKSKNIPEIGTVTEIKDSNIPRPTEGTSFTENILKSNPKDQADAVKDVNSKTAYVAKENLGVDGRGKKIVATTEVDTKTGDAVVYYDKSLDANPKLRQLVWDFEEPHILDKRLSGTGGSFTPALGSPGTNRSIMENALGSFAKKLSQDVEEVAMTLHREIVNVGGKGKTITEQFADAYGLMKNDPAKFERQAPVLAKFFKHQIVEPRYSKQVTTESKIAREMPAAKQELEVFDSSLKDKELSDRIEVAKNAIEIQKKTRVESARQDQIVYKNNKTGRMEVVDRDAFEGTKDYAGAMLPKPDKIQGEVLAVVGKDGKVTVSGSNSKNDIKSKPSKFASTGLDTGKRVEGRSSFNPDKINAPEDVEILFNKMDAGNKNFSSQRISKNKESMKDLARLVGLEVDDLLELNPGSIANSETLVAARQIILNKAADLSNKLKGINIDKASLAQKAEVRDAFLQLVSMQKSMAGLRTEASNVLRSFGVELKPGENIAIDELIRNLQKLGIDDIDPTDLAALEKATGKMMDSMERSFLSKVGNASLRTWYASILSGPKTSIRNILSTSANILSDLASKSANPKQWKEIPTAVKGMMDGFNSSAQPGNLKEIFSLKTVDPDTGKFYDFNPNIKDDVFSGRWEKFGRATEVVGRILNAQDRRLAGAAKGMEEASLKVYSKEMTEATQKAITEAYGVSSVFRGKPKGRIIEAGVEAANTLLQRAPEFRIIMPFVQTVGNVLDRQFDYLPLFSMLRLGKFKVNIGGKVRTFGSDVIERQVENIARDFGITDDFQKQLIATRLRDQQIGRMVFGLGLTAGAVALAAEGRISGVGPADYNDRVQLQRTGWRPNSVKIGDLWIPYTYLGPMAGILAIAGNVHDGVKYNKSDDDTIMSMIGNGVVGWAQTQLDNSFLSGVNKFIEAIGVAGNPGRYLTNLAAGLTPIPQALTQTIDMTKSIASYAVGDPALRQQYETRDYVSKIRRSLGLTGDVFGIADELNPRIDQFGQPMTSDIIFGITPSVDKTEAMPVDSFLLNNDIRVSIPVYNREYSVPGKKGETRPLTEDEYNTYVTESGQAIYERLIDILPSLESMDKEKAQERVKKEVDSIREKHRKKLLRENNQ